MVSVYFFGNDPFIYHKDHLPNLLDRMGCYLSAPGQLLHRKFHPFKTDVNVERIYKNEKEELSLSKKQHPILFVIIYVGLVAPVALDLVGCFFRSVALFGAEASLSRKYLVERYRAQWALHQGCKKSDSIYFHNFISHDPYYTSPDSYKNSETLSLFKDEKKLLSKKNVFLSQLNLMGEEQKETVKKLENAFGQWLSLTPEIKKKAHDIKAAELLSADEQLKISSEAIKAFTEDPQITENDKNYFRNKKITAKKLKELYPQVWDKHMPRLESLETKQADIALKNLADAMKEASNAILNASKAEYLDVKANFETLNAFKAEYPAFSLRF